MKNQLEQTSNDTLLIKNSTPVKLSWEEGDECPLCHQILYKINGLLTCSCLDIDENGNLY